MYILATDDEPLALQSLIRAINEALPDVKPVAFTVANDCLTYAKTNPCDIAFLDIEMRDMNGISLAKKLKKINPKINIIFVTSYSEYQGEALSLYVSGYIQKPATKSKIKREIENLRHPIKSLSHEYLKAHCFGNFDIFIGDEPLKFKYQKTKELLAILIERNGATLTSNELMAILWEDDSINKKSYYHNLLRDLSDTLEKSGHRDVLVKRRGNLAIIPAKIICDYYDWFKGIPYALNSYTGEFMSQYSWADLTLGVIDRSIIE